MNCFFANAGLDPMSWQRIFSFVLQALIVSPSCHKLPALFSSVPEGSVTPKSRLGGRGGILGAVGGQTIQSLCCNQILAQQTHEIQPYHLYNILGELIMDTHSA